MPPDNNGVAALRMREGAWERGIDVLADAYPYTAAATGLATRWRTPSSWWPATA